MFQLNFYQGKKVFVTGHTGFKGTWLCKMLLNAGAKVTGYAINPPPTSPSLFHITGIENHMTSVIGDIRDDKSLKEAFEKAQPEIVLHLAAQPIVRRGYQEPVYTYDTNVMGTVHVLECIRTSDCVKSFLNVTTDKVYQMKNEGSYRETDRLCGFDPYSNSKSCSELVTECYKNSFLIDRNVAVSTVRAGNVIGGGDFAKDRIISDCVISAVNNREIIVRNPFSVRPYQHVLEPLYVYLMIAAMQYGDKKYAGNYNVGPDEEDCLTTGRLVELFLDQWGGNLQWIRDSREGVKEAVTLRLDSSKLKNMFGWSPRWSIETAVEMTIDWTKSWIAGEDVNPLMDQQIEKYLQE